MKQDLLNPSRLYLHADLNQYRNDAQVEEYVQIIRDF